ncbi:MAG: nucleoside deaminase [Ignavibacteria bacterium]|nr:nucleoside deaminase [Ignavibacteria bacterium]
MDHNKFMQMAIDKALEGVKSGQSPFGACIVKDGKVIACEHNIVLASCDITAHAEIHAIRNACKNLQTIDLSGCEIYSTCEPCPMCFTAIHWARIDRIYYGASISDAEKFGFNELRVSNKELKNIGGSKVEIIPEILKKQCIELFDYWNSAPGKRTY